MRDKEAIAAMKKLKYWLDPNFYYGDYSVPKFALFWKSTITGEEDICFYMAYEDLEGYTDDDVDANWAAIDREIEDALGFLPEYVVG